MRSRGRTRRSRPSSRAATARAPAVCHAIEAHHYEVQPQTVEAVLLIAADAISASRPGARGESLDHYVKRLESLEQLAANHPGVEKVYALQAGREIRVLVKPQRDRRRRRGAALARDRARDRGPSRVPGPDPRHGHPREPRDRRRGEQARAAPRPRRRGLAAAARRSAPGPVGPAVPCAGDAPLPRAHVRVPDECARLRADQGAARGARARRGAGREDADVVVFNTCTIREKPDTKLAAYLGARPPRKRADPARVIAVGGCYAEAQRERIFELLSRSSTSRSGRARSRIWASGSARAGRGSRAGASGSTTARSRQSCRCTVSGRSRRGSRSRWAATRSARTASSRPCADARSPPSGRDPRRGHAPRRARACKEVTLLGQNVNSWGRDLLPDVRTEFGELLRAVDAVDGIERIRFTSPHPKDFREPVIAAIAECDAVCEHVHLPLQSGSTRILKAMRRTYSRERYLALVEKLRAAIPGRRARHRHHRRLSGRDRGRLRARRSRSPPRWGTTARSRSSTRRAPAPRRPRCRSRCRTRSRSSGSSGSSR